ncbi:MAG: hypothetical protein V1720_13600 [bacterium]
MNNLNDELINQYIDKELDSAQVNELKKIIESNPDELKKLKTHQFVDQTLYELEAVPAPDNFTERFMQKLNSVLPAKYSNFKFFKVIIGIFGLLILGTLVSVFLIPAPQNGSSMFSDYIDKIKEIISQKNISLDGLFSNKTILFIGGFLTCMMMIMAYFIIDSHKTLKHKLSGFGEK